MCRKTRYILLPVTIYAINVDIYVVAGDNICPATKYAVRIIRDGEVWKWGKSEIAYLSLHCHHQNDSCIKMGNFEYKIHNILKDDEGRYILIDIEMLNKRLTLANLYAPSSGDHPEFFDNVINEVVSMDNELIVIGGDWNAALNPKIDSNQPSSVYRARSRKKIIDFMNSYDLVDVYRTLHKDTRKYSWRRFNSTQRSRLDYLLVSEVLGLDITSAWIFF